MTGLRYVKNALRHSSVFRCNLLQEEDRRLRAEMQLLGERLRQLEHQFLPSVPSQVSQKENLLEIPLLTHFLFVVFFIIQSRTEHLGRPR